MDPEENMDGGMDDDADGDDAQQAEYVKKVFVANVPYISKFNTDKEVEETEVKNSR